MRALDVPQRGRAPVGARHARAERRPSWRRRSRRSCSAAQREPRRGGRSTQGSGGVVGAGVALADGVTAVVPVDGAHLVVVVGSDEGFRPRGGARRAHRSAARGDDAAGQAHVIYLANTNAEDMAATLQALGLSSRVAAPARRRGGAAAGARRAQPRRRARVAGCRARCASAPTRCRTRSSCSPASADFLMVRDLIAKLDVPRRQVYVEATILDLSVDKRAQPRPRRSTAATSVGGGARPALVVVRARRSLNSASRRRRARSPARSAPAGCSPACSARRSTSPASACRRFGVMLQALEHNKDVNVISRPHLLTMDNTKASLSVGQSIPFPTRAWRRRPPAAPALLDQLQPPGRGAQARAHAAPQRLRLDPPRARRRDLRRARRADAANRRAARPPTSAPSRPRWWCATARRWCSAACRRTRESETRREDPAPRRHPAARAAVPVPLASSAPSRTC